MFSPNVVVTAVLTVQLLTSVSAVQRNRQSSVSLTQTAAESDSVLKKTVEKKIGAESVSSLHAAMVKHTLASVATFEKNMQYNSKWYMLHEGSSTQGSVANTDYTNAALASLGGLGALVPLTDAGYQEVVRLQSNEEMETFIRRLVENDARFVKDLGGLSGFVPYYSGIKASSNLTRLKDELRDAPFVVDGEGRTAQLTPEGYNDVKSLGSPMQMMAFVRRWLAADHKTIIDEHAFAAMIWHYDGTFDDLKKQLDTVTWIIWDDGDDLLDIDETIHRDEMLPS